MDSYSSPRAATSSTPEDLFAELFTEVFGIENARLLTPQFPVEDIFQRGRFIDFALRTIDERVAFEIDGLTWHVPDAERIAGYEDQLLRQNSLVHQGWRVFRWTDRQIADEPEQAFKRATRAFPGTYSGPTEFRRLSPQTARSGPRAPAPPGGGTWKRSGDSAPKGNTIARS